MSSISPDERYDRVVFHCQSSSGRGPRCAGWYIDAAISMGLRENSFVLKGGIKAWIKAYPDNVIRLD